MAHARARTVAARFVRVCEKMPGKGRTSVFARPSHPEGRLRITTVSLRFGTCLLVTRPGETSYQLVCLLECYRLYHWHLWVSTAPEHRFDRRLELSPG